MTKRVTPEQGRQPYFMCPCGDDHKFTVGHLPPGTDAGPWFCDECGVGWRVFIDAGHTVEIEDSGRRKRTAVITLRMKPLTEELTITVDGMHLIEPMHDEDDVDNHRYFYEEHTCPTNIMHAVIDAKLGDDEDPHGLFEFVSCDLCDKPPPSGTGG